MGRSLIILFLVIVVLAIAVIFISAFNRKKTEASECSCIDSDICLKSPNQMFKPIIEGGRTVEWLDLDLWNLEKAKGEICLKWRASDKAIILIADLWDVKLKNPSYLVTGYSEILVAGYSPWSRAHAQPYDWLPLPMKIKDFISTGTTYVHINYSIWLPKFMVGNYAFESWLTSNPSANGVGPGELEVMIWLVDKYRDYPWGENVLNLTLDITVNGQPRRAT